MGTVNIIESTGFNYLRRVYYLNEVEELKKKLRPKLSKYIKQNSTTYVGKGVPRRSLGRSGDWYVNINNGVVFLKTLRWSWNSLAKVIGGWEETRTIYRYQEDRPDKPTEDINPGWSTKPLTVLPDTERSIWFSTARYIDGLRVSTWTFPAIFQRKLSVIEETEQIDFVHRDYGLVFFE